MFGGTPARNMVNFNEKLPAFPKSGPDWGEKEQVQAWENEWVLWKADLGTRTYGSPVVAGGRVYIGTNNEHPRNNRDTRRDRDGQIEPIDKGILMVFDEKTGEFLWQAVHDRRPAAGVSDEWPMIGLTSTPTVVEDRVYYVANNAIVVCADANGLKDGNQGYQNEKYQNPTDVDILWQYDMRKELEVHPHCATNCGPLVVGDRVYLCTSNGVDESHLNLPSPGAPSLICLNAKTGVLVWKDHSAGRDVMHGQWSSPAYADEPVPQVIFGSGDGWLRGYDPATGKVLWKFDCNHKGAIYALGGTGDKSDFIAMPVVHNGRVYIGTGQDPEHFTGEANLWCIDLKLAVERGAKAQAHDVSPTLLVRTEKDNNGKRNAVTKPNPASAMVWNLGGEDKRKWAPQDFRFGRTLSTVAIVDDVLYATTICGYVYCVNANTGEVYWKYDTRDSIWSSPYVVDNKVIVTTQAGEVLVIRHTAKPEVFDSITLAQVAPDIKTVRKIFREARVTFEKQHLLAKIEFPHAITSTPTIVNGTLYIPTEAKLFAIRSRK
jgi:outer membrane protein assembly factor BamB